MKISAKINSVKEWLLIFAINEFIDKWDKQNKDFSNNKRLYLKQYFQLISDKCVRNFYEKEE